ncbi:hypothetical protein Tco_1499090 [Tanacetum coccineum]
MDQLRLHLERENLHGVNAKTCLQALRTQFKEFLASKGVNATVLLNQGGNKTSKRLHGYEPSALQTKSEIETQMQRQEQKADMREAVDVGLVVTEGSGKKPDKQDINLSDLVSNKQKRQIMTISGHRAPKEEKTCKKRITPTGVTEGERGFEQTKRCYLTEVIPFFKTLKEHFAGVQTALFKEVKVMEEIFDQMNDEVDQNTVDKQCAEIVKKNLLIENENLIANCLSNQLLYDVEKSRCLDLEAEMSKEAPDFNSFFKIKNLEHQIQEKDNVIRDLKVLVSKMNDRSCKPYYAKDVTDLLEQNEHFRAEIEKVKQHYKELFESIKVTRASTNEKTSSLLTQIEDLKAQLEGNLKNATRNSVKTKVLAPGMYAIDVEPIPPRLKNNRSAHLDYINHLKESVETVRKIVKEARVVKPLDTAFNSACKYTKLSQELVEYVIGTCPKEFKEIDNKAAAFIPLIRQKQVTFNDTCRMLINDTQKQVRPQKVHQSNVTVIPSKGVNSSTEASRSKPRSNTNKNRILVPDESIVISRASSEGTGSKPGVPDEEKLILEWEADVDMLSCLGSSKEAKEPNLQISMDTLHNTNVFRALTASADVPSSITKTTDTTSTLQPPPPPLQKSTVHRDICRCKGNPGLGETKEAKEPNLQSFTASALIPQRKRVNVTTSTSSTHHPSLQKPIETSSDTKVLHYGRWKIGNPARAYIKQALGSYERSHKGVKASANSDIIFFFTSAQEGYRLLDDERLCLAEDLKKAHDHNQNKSK